MSNHVAAEVQTTEVHVEQSQQVETQLVLLSDVELLHVGGGILINNY